jgi:hypothetical protein
MGGGVATFTDSSPVISNCLFVDNESVVHGGGLVLGDYTTPQIIGCRFVNNRAEGSPNAGGAIACGDGCCPALMNCQFYNNSANRGGALVTADGCEPYLDGCVFAGNRATIYGGAWLSYQDGVCIAKRCTFHCNSCVTGGHIWELQGGQVYAENTIFSCCELGAACVGAVWITCCDVYGNCSGPGSLGGQIGSNGNIAEDPLYCLNPLFPHDLTLQEASPCAAENNPECGQIGARPVGCLGSDIEWEPAGIPSALDLASSVPNPFSRTAEITYRIPGDIAHSPVLLEILDPAGRLVRTLVSSTQPEGSHTITWSGADQSGRRVGGGVYYCQLDVGGQTVTRRIVYVR